MCQSPIVMNHLLYLGGPLVLLIIMLVSLHYRYLHYGPLIQLLPEAQRKTSHCLLSITLTANEMECVVSHKTMIHSIDWSPT